MKQHTEGSSFFTSLHNNRRGNTKVWMTFGTVLAIAVVSFVVLAILLGAMKNTSLSCNSGYTYNASADNCYQNSNHSNKGGLNEAGNVTNDGLDFISNVTAELDTAGTILGVSLLLVIIAGIGFAGYTQYKKMR